MRINLELSWKTYIDILSVITLTSLPTVQQLIILIINQSVCYVFNQLISVLRQKRQILTFEKQKPANIILFCLIKQLK